MCTPESTCPLSKPRGRREEPSGKGDRGQTGMVLGGGAPRVVDLVGEMKGRMLGEESWAWMSRKGAKSMGHEKKTSPKYESSRGRSPGKN